MIRTANQALSFALPRRADSPMAQLAFHGRRRLRGGISSTAVDALAAAIQTHEGYYPGSVSYRNNNPGNLVYAGQPGATRGDGGFAKFSSYAAGLAATKNQIVLDAVRGSDATGRPVRTVGELISSWAPSSDPRNDTASYIAAVAAQTGFDPDAPLSSLGAGSDYSVVGSNPDPVDSGAAGNTGFSFGNFPPELLAPVDLSMIGAPSVPMWGLLAAGVGGLFLLTR